MFDNFIEKNDNIVYNQWIAWIHSMQYRTYKIDYERPASEYSERLRRAKKRTRLKANCCEGCLGLDACHFPDWNRPQNEVAGDPGLLHPNCHCVKKVIPTPQKSKTQFAHFAIEKFTEWIFIKETEKALGKRKFFAGVLGYSIEDSQYLKDEIVRQAWEKYVDGDFEIQGRPTLNGQVINFVLRLKKNNSNPLEEYSFTSGWMVRPNGHITNSTPFITIVDKKED